ncbi:hypothetical protein D3C76_822410 [compost metagenome]
MRDLLGSGAQLVDGGGDAVGAARLIVEIAQGRIGGVQHAAGTFVDAMGRRRHFADRLVNALDKTVERRGQLADFIPRLHLQAPGQVAFAEGDIFHDPGQHF